MPKKFSFIAFLLLVIALVCVSCDDNAANPTTDPSPHRVETIHLGVPTSAPTPEREQVTSYQTLDDAVTLTRYGDWYVDPLLVMRSGWGAAEDIGAEDFARFYVSLSDERRGYSIDSYFNEAEGTYHVPSDLFCTTIQHFFQVNRDYIASLSFYDDESETFILPDDRTVGYVAEVYRVEETSEELHIRYILYSANSAGYFENTGSRYELYIEKGENAYLYISSAPVADDQPIPTPHNGEFYLNTEINSFYARRGMSVTDTQNTGDMILVSYSGRWSGLELFDRTTGETRPVAYFNIGENGERLLNSPPFTDFSSARLDSYSLRDNGDVDLLVRDITDASGEKVFPRIYTWSNGKMAWENYSMTIGSAVIIGSGGRGSVYDIVRGERSIAFVFDTNGATPSIRTSGSGNSMTIRFVGVTISEDMDITGLGSTNYSVTSVIPSGGDTLITISFGENIGRYRFTTHDPIAGSLPYIELEMIAEETDYPSGW